MPRTPSPQATRRFVVPARLGFRYRVGSSNHGVRGAGLFVVVSFLSAALLFSVEPMVARMLLPGLGGSSTVWTICMLFFQGALLAGYAYADLSVSRLGARRQAFLHSAWIALPLTLLPFSFGIHGDGATANGTNGDPTWELLGLLTLRVGLPFLAVAASAPLLQRWLADTTLPGADRPYALYAASNLGSMTALLAYPFLIEPTVGLSLQNRCWAGLYAAWVVLNWVVAWKVIRSPGAEREVAVVERVPIGLRARWIALAFVPSSLLLGVTTYLSTDVAAIPMLWVLPLALYLGSFIVVFASRPIVPHAWIQRAAPIGLVVLVLTMGIGPILRPELIPVHLLVFFLIACVCHGELNRLRPPPSGLTGFYLSMAIGGTLGGLFNALIATRVFQGAAEYPLMLALSALALPAIAPGSRRWYREFAVPIALGSAVVGAVVLLPDGLKGEAGSTALRVVLGLGALACFSQKDRPIRLSIATALVLVAGVLGHQDGRVVERSRSFFGVSKVVDDPVAGFHKLYHGSTLHGIQATDEAGRRIPRSYFHPSGPLGRVFAALDQANRHPRRAALVGLGAGAVASYARAGDEWTFHEIDPVVARIARDPRYFTYLSDAPAGAVRVRLGDGRLGIATAASGSLDLILIDAFSSDSIPVHLLTREALSLYRSRLAGDGLILVNISNRYFDLAPVMGALAADMGWTGWICRDTVLTREEARDGKSASAFVLLGPGELDGLGLAGSWRPLPVAGTVWTDDHADVLGCLIRGIR